MSAPEHIAPEQLVACPYRCEECGDRLTLDNGVVAFQPWDTVMVTIAHQDCAPKIADYIGFHDLLRDGLEGENGLGERMSRNPWWTKDCLYVLEMGHRMAVDLEDRRQRLAPAVTIMRPVSQSIPRRRPRTPDNPRNITTGTRTRVLERDGFKCRRCGNGPEVAPLVIDHIQPVAKGGTAAIENLQTLCNPCNAGKRDRDPTPHDLGARP